MQDHIPVQQIAKVSVQQMHSRLNNVIILTNYRERFTERLEELGFTQITPVKKGKQESGEILLKAVLHRQVVYICLALYAAEAMGLQALSEALCDECDAQSVRASVYYASFFMRDEDRSICLLGPVPVKQEGKWCKEDAQSAQFLPMSRRLRKDRLSAVFGGAALFKVRQVLMPHIMKNGSLPAFSVHGVFEDRRQGEGNFYAVLGGEPPTHLMLVRREDSSRQLVFSRAFFYYGERPESELELVQSCVLRDAPEQGLVELRTGEGNTLWAESLETILFPRVLPEGETYRWTLSLVTERSRVVERHDSGSISSRLLEKAKSDYERQHGSESAADFSFSMPGAENHPAPTQRTLTAHTRMNVRVLDVEKVKVDGCEMLLCRAQVLPWGEWDRVQVFVSPGAVGEEEPRVGDVMECEGQLYASPDALVGSSGAGEIGAGSAEADAEEASACREIIAAICTQEWDEFERMAHDDMHYTSRMNGTVLETRAAFVRYMSERKELWIKQGGWPGMSMDTGTILHEKRRRPCFMITCYGKRVGAGIVVMRDSKIAAIETLPSGANESFVPDEESNAQPTVFHPKRGHLTPHPAMQTLLQRYAATYLSECLRLHAGHEEPISSEGEEGPQKEQEDVARWVKLTRDEPSYCDLSFAYAQQVYAVCAVETELHPNNGGSLRNLVEKMPGLERFVAFAEKHNLVPCLFPAQRNYVTEPSQSWNLWDVRTLQPVEPQKELCVDATPPLSEWEKLCAGLAELSRRVVEKGGKVLAFHDTPELKPHFWYRDVKGLLNWIILRTAEGTKEEILADAELPLKLFPDARGHVVTAQVYGDSLCSTPARRGKATYVRFEDPVSLN